MTSMILGPRKRRTREHIVADQGIHYLEGFILDHGYVAERIERDYGYDLVMITFDVDGYAEPDVVWFQVKASMHPDTTADRLAFDLDIRDYNLWMGEQLPVILVLYDATARRAFWVDIKQYFGKNEDRQPKKGARWVRVHIPYSQRINRRAIAEFRRLKARGRG